MMILLLEALAAYLLGSVSGSLVMGAFRHVDIRDSGSGNAGGTNAFRTQGLRFALGVVVIDIGKGALAAGLLPWLGEVLAGPGTQPEQTALACGFMAVVGHCYPVWHGFRGGKGAATAVGGVLVWSLYRSASERGVRRAVLDSPWRVGIIVSGISAVIAPPKPPVGMSSSQPGSYTGPE